MTSALHHKKTTINLCEDSLTSGIFDTLFLLPEQLYWEILRKAVRATPQNTEQEMPTQVGHLLHYSFWPKWNPENTQNVNYVEPDVFIRFSEFDVIIEAKLYEEGLQIVLNGKKKSLPIEMNMVTVKNYILSPSEDFVMIKLNK